jgi:1,4-alpha-glucan branching enzyme
MKEERNMARKTKSAKTGRKRVKFATEAKDGSVVFVAGTFNEWNPTKNRLRMKDGVYTTTLLVSPGRHEYKFIVDGVWCLDPKCREWVPNDMGSLNSVLTVG